MQYGLLAWGLDREGLVAFLHCQFLNISDVGIVFSEAGTTTTMNICQSRSGNGLLEGAGDLVSWL